MLDRDTTAKGLIASSSGARTRGQRTSELAVIARMVAIS
jgi:hypothetical protein